MFDSHAHLNFDVFEGNLEQVITDSRKVGVNQILIPGTDLESSKKAVEIAAKHDGIYAAVGIHPHHLWDSHNVILGTQSEARRTPESTKEGFWPSQNDINFGLSGIEGLLTHPKVVAIGETGLDRHHYSKTKHQDYQITEEFINFQKDSLIKHLNLAIKYKKSLILHNREATDELLIILTQNWDNSLSYRSVIHCCEPNIKLLEFAKTHHLFIGVDGDITYSKEKQEFIKTIPLELLVLETDSPFLIPEPFRSQKVFPNTPVNLPLILKFISHLLSIPEEELDKITSENTQKLFSIS